MKKFIAILLLILCSIGDVQAGTKVKVKAITEFSSENPSEYIDLEILKSVRIGDYYFKENDILHCYVTTVVPPRHCKRNAIFYTKPEKFTRGSYNEKIRDEMRGKYSKAIISKEDIIEINPKEAAKKTAYTITSRIAKNISPAVSVMQGVIVNENGNRIISGISQLYKDSPFVYLEKGKHLEIKPEDKFSLDIKLRKKTPFELYTPYYPEEEGSSSEHCNCKNAVF